MPQCGSGELFPLLILSQSHGLVGCEKDCINLQPKVLFSLLRQVTVISTNIPNSKANAALERKSLNRKYWLYPLCKPLLTNEIKTFQLKPSLWRLHFKHLLVLG